MSGRDLIAGADVTNPELYVASATPWVIEAANPYFDWLLGGPERGRKTVAAMLTRDGSELSLRRMKLLVSEGRCIGGYLAMDGQTLTRCRRADTIYLLADGGPERSQLVVRIKESRDLFPPADQDEWYLSKVGVEQQLRGKGLGRMLVESYLADGVSNGYQKFRLDVCQQNEHAVNLYAELGFEVVRAAEIQPLGATYLSMSLQLA